MFHPEVGGFAGSRPAASSFLDRPRKEPKKGARGYAPATPRRLRLAFGQSRRRPYHGSASKCTATHQPPRRGRNASAGEPQEPHRRCIRGGTDSFTAPSVSTRWENRDQVEPSASVPVGCGGSLRVLARFSRGFLRDWRKSLRRTFGSFSSVRKGTRGRGGTRK